MLTDGADTVSLISSDEVLAAARRSGMIIYTVALKPPSALSQARFVDRRTAESEFTLKALAQDSGGLAFSPKSADELGGIYDKIAAEIAHQYVLAYEPGTRASDGALRPVSVRVPSRPRAEVRTRRGYYATQNR